MILAAAQEADGEREDCRSEQRQRRHHTDVERRQAQRGQVDREQNGDEAVAEIPDRAGEVDVPGCSRRRGAQLDTRDEEQLGVRRLEPHAEERPVLRPAIVAGTPSSYGANRCGSVISTSAIT